MGDILDRFATVLEAAPLSLVNSSTPFDVKDVPNDLVNTTYRLLAGGLDAIVPAALAEPLNIQDQLEVLDIEQFLAANVHERSFFDKKGRHTQTKDLIERYNTIIDQVETDPAFKIDVAQ